VLVLFAQIAIGEVADAAAEDVTVGFCAFDFEDLLAVYGETAVVFDVVDEFQHAFVAHTVELFVIQKNSEIADADEFLAGFRWAFYWEVIRLLIHTAYIVDDAGMAE
jgi:hypothetical protein